MSVFVKRRDGSVSAYRNAEFIPAYLIIPESSLSRCPKELWLPRTVRSFFFNWDVIDVVESDLFLELIIDAFAYLTWPYLGINDYMENYSGYDPVWDIAHNPTFWIQTMTDLRLIPTTEYLYQHGILEYMNFLTDREIFELLDQTVPVAFERYNLGVVIETAQAMGATPMQIIWRVMLPESVPSLITNFTLAITTIMGYTAMSGAVGGGGLGKLALAYGYQRYRFAVLYLAVIVLVIITQVIQSFGTWLARQCDKRLKEK